MSGLSRLLSLVLGICASLGVALLAHAGASDQPGESPLPAPVPAFVLGPPPAQGPVPVSIDFVLADVNDINDGAETFEFAGVVVMRWQDPRQAFDPAVEGVSEKVFQGAYQFDEISPGWYPQLVLVNQSGMFDSSGVMLRVRPDGSSTLIQTVDAIAEAQFDMHLFPFDEQRLEAVFEVLGYDRDQLRLQVDGDGELAMADSVSIDQWDFRGLSLSERERHSAYSGDTGLASTFVITVDVARQSWYVRRLIVMPLILIVLLSFSVFWMERSSVGDRLGVSFVGILTAVAYQLVMSDQLPRISYFTLMHAFIGVSFLTMCATVVVSLVVAELDKSGRQLLGDRIDRRCRWAFPLTYFAILLSAAGIAPLVLR